MNAQIVLLSLKQNGKLKSTARDTAKKLQAVDVKVLDSLVLIIQSHIVRLVLDAKRTSLLLEAIRLIAIQLVVTFINECVNEIHKIAWNQELAKLSSTRFTSEIKAFVSCVMNTFI